MISSRISPIAASTRGSAVKPSWLTNRAARIIRSGSSAKDSCGVAGVSSRRLASADSPSYGSMKRLVDKSTAIALTVKSRLTRSSSIESPKWTSGLRLFRS